MAQDSAPRRAAPCSDAREPRPRVAHAHWRPCAQRSPSDKRARAEHLTAHAALRAQHTSPDTPRACRRLQHARQPGERTRRKAPARPQRHAAARAALPPPARHPKICPFLPPSSSSINFFFLSNYTPKSPAVAVEDEHADANRSAAANAPAPAAAAAAPAQRSVARASSEQPRACPTL